MTPTHVLLCYLGRSQNDRGLRAVAELCSETGATLSVVVPVIDAEAPRGCCGIQGEQWRRLLDEATRDDAERAARVLADLGCPPIDVTVDVGASIPEIAAAAAARLGCDLVAVSRKRRPWSGGALSGRELNRLHRVAPATVVEL